ncbi:YneF family protein [Mycoplasmopsis synoviae]|uniref:YneF family protein n=2 Tax=Mycoplasmopsis synoviae TaxID=2109 RepID=Q4A5G0_MYCS5|nr:YneF family protein [Mycoplasmopsis synoviae]AAZ44011.1 conserved hypothetical protein [Mycoplasmopsis synoviae 53]AKB11322.1 membrane protein [Mycoplasmopsis synoviae ATCC 25204]AKJ20827.1 putative coding region [Mycoplasmopsis synoviae]AQU48152.1 putative coding region [Mycoplasmopsis synoviae]AWL84369.1 hypothetical protein MSH_03140 [Mycoplasmopsis synoviae]
MVEMQTYAFVLMMIFVVIGVGFAVAIVTFIYVKKLFEKQMRENPPISEKMIKVMFEQMGRPASQKQIKQVMNSMKAAKDSK